MLFSENQVLASVLRSVNSCQRELNATLGSVISMPLGSDSRSSLKDVFICSDLIIEKPCGSVGSGLDLSARHCRGPLITVGPVEIGVPLIATKDGTS